MKPELMSAVIIRELGNDDAPAYHALRLEGLRSAPTAFGSSFEEEAGFTREQVEARLTGGRPNVVTFGAFLNEQLVGAATLLCTTRVKTGHRANIVGMVVTGSARGNGIGRKLIDAIVAHARTMPRIEILTLSVTVGNEAARRLYERAGFETYATEPAAIKLDGAYFDLAWMALPLKISRSSDFRNQ